MILLQAYQNYTEYLQIHSPHYIDIAMSRYMSFSNERYLLLGELTNQPDNNSDSLNPFTKVFNCC